MIPMINFTFEVIKTDLWEAFYHLFLVCIWIYDQIELTWWNTFHVACYAVLWKPTQKMILLDDVDI